MEIVSRLDPELHILYNRIVKTLTLPMEDKENGLPHWQNIVLKMEENQMNKRGTGAIFCLIAGLLFSARYITAAIFMSNVASWDSVLFAAGLEYQGNSLLIFSGISFVLGVIYLVWGEIEDRRKRK